MNEYQRNINFTDACYELSEKHGYEVIYISNSKFKSPIRVGKVKCIEDLTFVEVEVCQSLNYRAIIIGNNYQHPSPITQVFQNGIAPYETLKKLYISNISPERYGNKIPSAFDYFSRIERCREYLEDAQKNTNEELKHIDNFIREHGLQWVSKITKINDSKLNI